MTSVVMSAAVLPGAEAYCAASLRRAPVVQLKYEESYLRAPDAENWSNIVIAEP